MGYDALFFDGSGDAELITLAFKEDRLILTRDTHILEWGSVSKGKIKALLIRDDNPEMQIKQVVSELKLKKLRPFTICLECNEQLRPVNKADIADRVPPYVLQTQDQFVECPKCQRIYWRGTHWQGMVKKLESLAEVDHY